MTAAIVLWNTVYLERATAALRGHGQPVGWAEAMKPNVNGQLGNCWAYQPNLRAGKTIEELFTDEMPTTETDFKPTAEMYNELRTKPKLRDKFSFRLTSSAGASFVGDTAPDEHGFGFSVLWNSHHSERARVSLHSYTLEGLESHGPMNNHFEERINYGGSVRFELIA